MAGEGQQAQAWNGAGGRAWVESQELLDRLFEPLEKLLLEDVSGRVLDVGCGAGATTLAIARALGPAGHCTGVDISEPMIAAARSRAEREGSKASFECGNAQTFEFGAVGFDRIVSRFGVMFFDDFVQAFGNLRRAAAPGARLRLITWREPAENPFMRVAVHAAAPVLPEMKPPDPDAPGQFGLADAARTERILRESGWEQIEIRPMNFACTFPEAELVGYFTRLGPVGLALSEADEETRARVIEAVRPAFNPYVHGSEVRFDAACWVVSARAAA